MSLFRIALRSIQQRGMASGLTMMSMSLGVMLVTIVLSIHGLIRESFQSNSSTGYNMVIGARGGSMQLALNSVYYLSKPIETIPYEYYLAFKSREERQAEIEDSVAFRVHEANWNQIEMQSLGTPLPSFGPVREALQLSLQETFRESERGQLGMMQQGAYFGYAEFAIPLCLGDYFGDYRVVATTPDFIDKITIDVETGEKMEFASGRNFKSFDEEHGFFECIVGSVVAKRKNISVGDKINPSHGAPDGTVHEKGFTVVGILDRSNTPNDRAVFINIEGFYLMEDHAKPLSENPPAPADDSDSGDMGWDDDWDDDWDDEEETAEEKPPVEAEAAPNDVDEDYSSIILQERLPLEQREVTSVLIRTAGVDQSILDAADEEDRPFLELAKVTNAMELENQINEGKLEKELNWTPFRPDQAQTSAQAIAPVKEIGRLLEVFVKPVQLILLVLTVMICVVAGISILVSIYNSMNERRGEIAVMRALGARRSTVMTIILIESMMLALAGGLLGWTGAHLINAAISPIVEAQTGVSISFWDLAPPVEIFGLFGWGWPKISPELALIPGLMLLSVLVGLYPSFAAYRTDVAKSLGT